MGILQYSKLIPSKDIEEIINKYNPQLEKYYYEYKHNDNGSINSDIFHLMTLLQPDIAKYFLSLFCSYNQMYLSDLKYFYVMIVSPKDEHKLQFISLLLFSGLEEIDNVYYIRNCSIYCFYFPFYEDLIADSFINSLKRTQTILVRAKFLKMFPLEKLNNFTFLKKVVDTKSYRLHIDNSLSYYCECAEYASLLTNKQFNQPQQPDVEKQYTQEMREYDQMKPIFYEYEKSNGGIYPLHEFERILKEIQLHPFLLKALINYLQKKLMNLYIHFDQFRDFLLLFNKKEEDKINLLFLLLSYPNKVIQIGDFKDYIPDNIQIESISQEKFIELSSELPAFKEIISSMEKVNVIPLLYFNIHPKDFIQKRIALNVAMNGLSFDNYLAISIILDNIFYCINADFIQQLEIQDQNNSNTSSKPPIINVSYLFDKNELLKREFVYKKDFYIVTKRIFDLLSRWFSVLGKVFPLKRIVYKDQSMKEMIDLLYYPTGHDITQIYNGFVYEIELYPLHLQFCSLELLYYKFNKDTMDKLMASLNEIVNHSSVYDTKSSNYSRKQKIGDFKKIVRLNGKNNVMFNIWIYYNNKLYLPDPNHNFEDEKIVNSCLLLIDSLVNNKYYYDIINKTPDSDLPNKTNDQEKTMKEDGEIKSIEEVSKDIKNNQEVQTKQNYIQCSPLGVGNIGNSCYLSSVLQIIINLPILKEILLLPQIPYFINKRNKHSHNGIFILELINLIKKRWTNDNEKDIKIINPRQLKIIIGKVHPQFDNYEQQDAHEFLTFLLDECNEEINLKTEKAYIQNPELEHRSIEALSNISWANHMRISASFINALFLFQLRSNLTCEQCNKTKISFETSSNLLLPIPLCPTIHLSIILYRLPFEYKVYYNSINPQFHAFLKELSEKRSEESLENILKEFHKAMEYNEELGNLSIPIEFNIEVERNWYVEEIITRIKKINYLQLEPLNRNRIENNSKIIIDEVYEMTYLAILSSPGNLINHKLKIDSCFQEGHTLKIFELLNTNGLKRLKMQSCEILSSSPKSVDSCLYEHEVKCIIKEYERKYHQETLHKNNMNSANNRIAYYSQDLLNRDNRKMQKQTEYILPIQHYYQISRNNYLFHKIAHSIIHFPEDYLLVNNSKQNITARHLYDYIWAKYKKYIKEPNRIQSRLWWNSIDSDQPICYPFNLKWSKRFLNTGNMFICSQCPYYRFCSGCIIDPFSKDNLFFDSESIIIVVWCSLAYKNDLKLDSLNIKIDKTSLIDENDKKEKENNLDDCLNLFFEKEKLDEKLKCDHCQSMQSFTKNYQLDKPPYVLIISLNRFKYAAMYNKKISTMITFPLYDFKQGNEVYDLYGVINHYGSMNSGHYTAIVKHCNQWIGFDDARFFEIPQSRVVSKEAYILVYIAKREINDWDYYKMLMSIIKQMNEKNDKRMVYKPEWTFGQPVKTTLGNGYYVRSNDNGIDVQLNNAELHSFNENEVVIETTLDATNEETEPHQEMNYNLTTNHFNRNIMTYTNTNNKKEFTQQNTNDYDGQYQCIIM